MEDNKHKIEAENKVYKDGIEAGRASANSKEWRNPYTNDPDANSIFELGFSIGSSEERYLRNLDK